MPLRMGVCCIYKVLYVCLWSHTVSTPRQALSADRPVTGPVSKTVFHLLMKQTGPLYEGEDTCLTWPLGLP